MTTGDCVIFHTLPDWVHDLPEQSSRVFEYCLGRTYQIIGIENGLYVLDVSHDIDELYGGYMNDIRVEGEYIRLVTNTE